MGLGVFFARHVKDLCRVWSCQKKTDIGRSPDIKWKSCAKQNKQNSCLDKRILVFVFPCCVLSARWQCLSAISLRSTDRQTWHVFFLTFNHILIYSYSLSYDVLSISLPNHTRHVAPVSIAISEDPLSGDFWDCIMDEMGLDFSWVWRQVFLFSFFLLLWLTSNKAERIGKRSLPATPCHLRSKPQIKRKYTSSL